MTTRPPLTIAATMVSACTFALPVVLLAGCGATSENQPTGVGDEFAARALAVCQTSLKQKQDWQPFPVSDFDPSDPDPSKFPEVSSWLTKEVAPTLHTWLSSLEALGTPPSAQADWTATLAAVKKIDELNSDQITAANKHDAGAFAAATAASGSTQDELVAASEKAGVADCADVHAD